MKSANMNSGLAGRVTGILGLGFGGLGVLASLVLLLLVWRSVGWVQNVSSGASASAIAALEHARDRLIHSERRIRAVHSACGELQEELNQRVRDRAGWDEEVRAKRVELLERAQEAETEIRRILEQNQAILRFSHEVLTGVRTRFAPERLDRLLTLVETLEALTRAAALQLDEFGETAEQARLVLRDVRNQQAARTEARWNQVVRGMEDALLTATDAAQRSAELVRQTRDEIHALDKQVGRISRRVGWGLTFFLVWNFTAQLCLARSGWRAMDFRRGLDQSRA